jgi:hypothetical protein
MLSQYSQKLPAGTVISVIIDDVDFFKNQNKRQINYCHLLKSIFSLYGFNRTIGIKHKFA